MRFAKAEEVQQTFDELKKKYEELMGKADVTVDELKALAQELMNLVVAPVPEEPVTTETPEGEAKSILRKRDQVKKLKLTARTYANQLTKRANKLR